jgi:hydroxymethylpyrimidine pyrophosphatase-like HAD family hydrolase
LSNSPRQDSGDARYSFLALFIHKGKRCLAIGDGEKDISMTEYCGLGIAMRNSSGRVKAVTNFVTASNDDIGIAKALEKFLYEIPK